VVVGVVAAAPVAEPVVAVCPEAEPVVAVRPGLVAEPAAVAALLLSDSQQRHSMMKSYGSHHTHLPVHSAHLVCLEQLHCYGKLRRPQE
jgi:hypothetical protein